MESCIRNGYSRRRRVIDEILDKWYESSPEEVSLEKIVETLKSPDINNLALTLELEKKLEPRKGANDNSITRQKRLSECGFLDGLMPQSSHNVNFQPNINKLSLIHI